MKTKRLTAAPIPGEGERPALRPLKVGRMGPPVGGDESRGTDEKDGRGPKGKKTDKK